MPFNYQQVMIRDFSGGITDNYINAQQNQCQIADNYLIEDTGLRLRSGNHVVYDSESLQRINGLFEMNNEIFVIRGASLYSLDSGALTAVLNPSGAALFAFENDNSYPESAEWRNQLHLINQGIGTNYNRPMRVWRDETNSLKSVEIGLPEMGSVTGFDGTPIYLFRVIYEYTYMVGDTTFKTVSPFYQEYHGTPTPIINVPELTSFAYPRLDVLTIKKVVYRNDSTNSPAFRKVAEQDNNITLNIEIVDYTPYEDGILLYTEGGLVEHFRAPKCKHMMIVNNVAYYMDVIEELDSGDELRPYRFVQSIPSAPSATDPTYFEDVDDDIVGGSHIKGLPIIFTKSFIYRIEGVIDASGNGSIRKRVISDSIGCVSNNSIVRTEQGIFFAGINGFYYTDGYQYKKLSKHLDDSYLDIVSDEDQIKRMIGVHDDKNQRIWFGCSEGTSENDLVWILDLNTFGFTKVRGLSMFFSSLLYLKGNVYRGDEQGYIYQFDDDDASDVRREFGVPAVDWETERIPYKYKTIAVDAGNPHVKKYGQEMTISINSTVPAVIKLISNNDDGEKTSEMKEIRLSGSWTWFDPNFVWRDPDFVWRLAETQTKKRHFPRGSSRFRRKQIEIEPARTNLFKSDVRDVCEITVDPLDANIFFLDLIAPVSWPRNIRYDFFVPETNTLQVLGDSPYNVEYQIIERTSDQRIKVAGSTLVESLGQKWIIRGFKRSQLMEIKAISMNVALIDNTGGEYKTNESGENS